MTVENVVGTIDFAQITLYVFWIFFAGLIFYLRREDRREGYPLYSEVSGAQKSKGFLLIPEPKTFSLHHGGTVSVPNFVNEMRAINVEKVEPWPGAPYAPTGDPMADGVGAASYAERADTPDLTFDGRNKIVPLRIATDFAPAEGERDLRGLSVIAGDGRDVGKIADMWVDRAELLVRYLEVDRTSGGKAIVPMTLARVSSTMMGQSANVHVKSIFSTQFAGVPALAKPDQITLLEEDKIQGYYAGGHLYASADRSEPLL